MKTILTTLCFICACVITPIIASETGYSSPACITGLATYYTVKSCQREGASGVLTASGQKYDESALTCALPFHPQKVNGRRTWGQKYLITNLLTQRQIVLFHTDYGPGKKARKNGVIVDLIQRPSALLGEI